MTASMSGVRFDQRRHGVIDMGAISCRLRDTGARDQTALRPRVPGTCGHVVGVEQIREPLIERTIGRIKRSQQKLLEEPRDVSAMPFRRTGVGHRLNDLVLGTERRRPAFGFGAHRTKGLEPTPAPIAGLRRERGIRSGRIAQSNQRRSSGAWHCWIRKTGGANSQSQWLGSKSAHRWMVPYPFSRRKGNAATAVLTGM